jgi:hypothetical protein
MVLTVSFVLSLVTGLFFKWEQDGGDMDVIWANREAKYF